jgi:hypothetical protein
MEDKNIQLIRDLLIEKINFDAVDKSMDWTYHHTDKNKRDFYLFIDSRFRIIVEKIYFEDDCQKYKIFLRPKRYAESETNFKRNLTTYGSDMIESFSIDEEGIIKTYNDTFRDPSMSRFLEFMLNCTLVLNHDRSIHSYTIEADTSLVNTRHRDGRRIIKKGSDPKLSLLYEWLKEDFESSQIELKEEYKNG